MSIFHLPDNELDAWISAAVRREAPLPARERQEAARQRLCRRAALQSAYAPRPVSAGFDVLLTHLALSFIQGVYSVLILFFTDSSRYDRAHHQRHDHYRQFFDGYSVYTRHSALIQG